MPRRRDDIEICMEILDLLIEKIDSISITDVISHTRIKHTKAKQILDSMEKSNWIEQNQSFHDDQRYKSFYRLLPEGERIIFYYKENIQKIFNFLEEE